MNDPQIIWQDQSPDSPSISIELIHRRAQNTQAKLRRGFTIWITAIILHVLGHVAQELLSQPRYSGWIGVIEFGTLILILLYWRYAHIPSAEWPLSIAPRAGATPGIVFYRRQLEIQRDWFNEDYSGVLSLIFISIVFVIHAAQYPVLLFPFGLLFIIGAVMWYARKRRERIGIQHELNDLNSGYRQQKL